MNGGGYFYIALLINSLIFIVIYEYRRIFKPQKEIYATLISNINEISFSQFSHEPILVLIIALFIVRIYFFFLKDDRKYILADSALFASVGYAFAYFLLKLYSGYYLFPSVLLSIPAFYIFMNNRMKKIVALILVITAFCLNFIDSKHIVLNDWEHRKSDHTVFEDLVRRSNNGWKIFWLSDFVAKNTEDDEYIHYDRVMCMNRFQHFLKYYSDNCPFLIELIFDTKKIDSNCVVIINKSTLLRNSFAEEKEKFFRLSPVKIAKINDNIVYEIKL